MGRGAAGADGSKVWGGAVQLPNMGGAWRPLPETILNFWLKIVHLAFILTRIASSA